MGFINVETSVAAVHTRRPKNCSVRISYVVLCIGTDIYRSLYVRVKWVRPKSKMDLPQDTELRAGKTGTQNLRLDVDSFIKVCQGTF